MEKTQLIRLLRDAERSGSCSECGAHAELYREAADALMKNEECAVVKKFGHCEPLEKASSVIQILSKYARKMTLRDRSEIQSLLGRLP